MNREELERLYCGEFASTPDWPECDKTKTFNGIYSHKCPNCGVEFSGYKRRLLCYPCDIENESKAP